jgi:hypothetical protein
MTRGRAAVVVAILLAVAVVLLARADRHPIAESGQVSPDARPAVATTIAPTPTSTTHAESKASASLAVHVVSRGKPIGDARVSSWKDVGAVGASTARTWEPGPSGLTNREGRTTLDVVSGRWLIAVEPPGHQRRATVVTHRVEQPGVAEFDLSEGASISGLVVAQKSQLPIGGALVTSRALPGEPLPDDAAHTVVTDANGHFTLEGLSPADDILLVAAPSYSPLTARPSQLATPLRLELVDSAYLTGRVRFPDGGVAAGAHVFATSTTEVTDVSNAGGSFSLEVTAGTWTVGASLAPWVAILDHPVSINPGETSELDLLLRAGGQLEGTVRRAKTGEVLAGAEITVSGVAGELARAVSDELGHYTLAPMPNGMVDVRVHANTFLELNARGVLTHAEGTTHFDPLLLEPGTIAGHLETRTRPVADVQASVFRVPEVVSSTSDPSGNFQLTGVPPGAHWVELQRVGYPIARRQVTVSSGETTRVTFALDDTLVHLAGVLLDIDGGAARTGIEVHASTADSLATAVTQLAGAFDLELAPGSWHLHVIDEFNWAATMVELSEGPAPPAVTLQLQQKRGSLVCLIVDEAGRPAAGVRARVQGKAISTSGYTAGDGTVSLPSLSDPGETLQVSAASHGRLGHLDLPPDAKDCTVHLQPPATLALHVKGAPRGMTEVQVPDGLGFDFLGTAGAPLQFSGADAEFPIPPGTTTITLTNGSLSASPTVTASPGQRVELEVTLAHSDGG